MAPPARRPLWAAVCAVVFIAGVAGWCACALGPDSERVWRALLINFIYFTPLAAGMVVWPALLTVARGEWFHGVARYAKAAVLFAPVSLLAFAALWLGRDRWAAWLHESGLPNAVWLDERFLFGRDAVALAVLWLLAIVFVRRAGRRSKALAAWLVLAYCIVFTLLAMDLVMALDPHWFSTLFGGYFFISGMYAAVAAWTLAVLLQGRLAAASVRHDLGKLIVAFSLLTTYMMFSQLIVIWYENLPDEVRFVIPRLTKLAPPWPYVSAGLLALVYIGPLVFLLTVWSKRSRWYLAISCAAVLVGLWAERWWLVTPTLGGEMTIGLAELSLAAAFAAALVLCVGWIAPRFLPAPEEGGG
jgi:hypothetical protein